MSDKPNYNRSLGEEIKRLQGNLPAGIELRITEDAVEMKINGVDQSIDIDDGDAELVGSRVHAGSDLFSCMY